MTGPAARDRRGERRDRRPAPLLRSMLGEVLRRTRLAQGRTLADVARSARVSVPYLSEVERGRKEASSEILAAICGALGISVPDVLIEAVLLAGTGLAGTGLADAGLADAGLADAGLADAGLAIPTPARVAPIVPLPAQRPEPGAAMSLLAA